MLKMGRPVIWMLPSRSFFHERDKMPNQVVFLFFQILKNRKRLMLLSVDLRGFEANWYWVIYYVYIFFHS